MERNRYIESTVALSIFFLLILSCKPNDNSYSTWSVYRGDPGNTAYSSLHQINKENVDRLEVAWIYHTEDAAEKNRSAIQCNPIIANGKMYVTSPKRKVIALDPASGKEIWRFVGAEAFGISRGLTYWEDQSDKRIYFVAGPFLYALDADNGNVIAGFGDHGKVDLRVGLGRDPAKLAVWASTPGIIYKDVLIQGTSVGEGYDAAPGIISAYDVRSGKTIWTFHTIPQPGEFGYDTWPENAYLEVGGANSWAGMSLIEKSGRVFIPQGIPTFVFNAGNRTGTNLFGNCCMALAPATRK